MSAEVYQFVASGQDSVRSAYRSIATSAERSASDQVKAAQKATKALDAQVRAAERAAAKVVKDRSREAIREKNREAKEWARAEREISRMQKQEAAKRKREREKEARDSARIAARGVRDAERAEQSRSRRFRSAAAGIGGAAIRGIGLAGGALLGVTGLAARDAMNLQQQATRLAIQGGTDPRTGKAFNATQVREKLETTALSVKGTKAEDIGEAQGAFVAKTGRLDLAQDFSRTFAEISLATGTAAKDIGSAAADLFEKFDIKTIEDMNRALSVLAVQGKRGSFELQDAASQFPKVAAAASRFGLKGSAGLATLGGLTQIAKRATPTAEDAATAVENMFVKLTQDSALIKRKTGTDVFKDKGKTQTNDITDILVGTISGAKGNLETLQQIFDIRGIKAVSPLVDTFNETFQGTKGTDQEKLAAATAALRKEIEGAVKATGAEAEMKRDLATAQQTAGAQLTAVWQRVQAAAGQQLVPALTSMAMNFAAFVEKGGLSPLITTVNALAESFMAASDVIRNVLGIKDVAKPPAQRMKEAREELSAVASTKESLLSKVRGGETLTPEEMTQLNELNAKTVALTQEATAAENEAFKPGLEAFAKPMTKEQFAEKFAQLGHEATGVTVSDEQRRGVRLAEAIQGGDRSDVRNASPAQQDLLAQFREIVEANRSMGLHGPGGAVATDVAAKGMAEFLQSIAAASAALRKMNPGGNAAVL